MEEKTNIEKMVEPTTKTCPNCSQEKSTNDFHKNSAQSDGLQTECKECSNERRNDYPNYTTDKRREYEKKIPTDKMAMLIERAERNSKKNPANPDEVAKFRKVSTTPPRPVRKPIAERKPNLCKGSKRMTETAKFYKNAFLEAYRNIASWGLRESTMARLFGMPYSKFEYILNSDPEADAAYQDAMTEVEQKLSMVLLHCAKGYYYEEEKCKWQKSTKTGDWIEVERVVDRKHQPTNINALIFYLTNKFPDKWKVSRELLTGRAEPYDSNPRQRNRKSIEVIARDVLAENPEKSEGEYPVQDGLARVSGGSEQTGTK